MRPFKTQKITSHAFPLLIHLNNYTKENVAVTYVIKLFQAVFLLLYNLGL